VNRSHDRWWQRLPTGTSSLRQYYVISSCDPESGSSDRWLRFPTGFMICSL
jgi:hypothetical protein